jgi:hypothetical protein
MINQNLVFTNVNIPVKAEFIYYFRRGTKFFFKKKTTNSKLVMYCSRKIADMLKESLVIGETYIIEDIIK